MAQLFTLPLEAPPDTTQILVAYYDETERRLLYERTGVDLLGGMTRELLVPTPDLCAYFLYYKRRPGVAGFESHADLVTRWHHALVEFEGVVEFANSSIRLTQKNGMSAGSTERLGEAIGLSVASAMHGLHQADWLRVPTTTDRKTLDFWHPITASDGKQFVQVESKGAADTDNRQKSSAVSKHKAKIKAKKDAATPDEQASSVLYGTIAVLDDRPDSVTRCWLVDPPAGVPDDPARFKVLARLSFVAELVTFLGARSNLAAALQTRLSALRALKDIAPLDRVPLRTGVGGEYSEQTYALGGERHPWFSSKSVVADGPAGGQVFAVDTEHVLFIGIQESLLVHAARQHFEAVRAYQFPGGTVQKIVNCVVPLARFRKEFEPRMTLPEGSGRDGYVRFSLSGHLHYCQSGLVWGVLPIPQNRRA